MKSHKYLIQLALVFISTLSFLGCSSMYEVPEVVYLIKQGNHKSNVENSLPGNGLRYLKSKTLQFTARFDESVRYKLDQNDQGDINKLFGFSDCNSHHHQNSARFGWSYNIDTDMVDIYAYYYVSGKRHIENLGSAQINEAVRYRIVMGAGYYQFELKNSVTRTARGSECKMGMYYLLFPYFGGNRTAPHDIKIYIIEDFS